MRLARQRCSHCKSSWFIHAHDCEAAEILGLERRRRDDYATCRNMLLRERQSSKSDDAKEITIPRDHYDLLKEAAEEWAKDWRRPTQLLRTVRCKSCLSATDRRAKHVSPAMVVHTHNRKAARILGLKREEG